MTPRTPSAGGGSGVRPSHRQWDPYTDVSVYPFLAGPRPSYQRLSVRGGLVSFESRHGTQSSHPFTSRPFLSLRLETLIGIPLVLGPRSCRTL